MKWLREHSLGLVVFLLFTIFLVGQAVTGFRAYNDDQEAHSQQVANFTQYLTSGHFIEATFENWESEFLQMGGYVVLTAYLVQKGSAESKKLEDIEGPVGTTGKSNKTSAPWPVRHGGGWLRLYEHSLSL